MQMIIPDGSLISYFSTMVKQNGGINLAQGIPGFEPPEELPQIVQQVVRESFHQYPPGVGNFNLTGEIIQHFSNQRELNRNEILILQGATEALSLAFLYVMKKCGGSFTTLAFSPPYESYRQLPLQFDMPFIELNLNSDGSLPIEQVLSKIETENVKLIFLASPGNPHGQVFSKSEIDQLVDVCRQKQCYLLFDAVYQSIYFEEAPYVPFNKLNPYLFIADSFSKRWSITGWRIGYLIYDSLHTNELRTLHDYTGLCANSIFQETLARFASEHKFGKAYSDTLREQIKNNYIIAEKELAEMGFTTTPASGGYFIWTKLPAGFDHGYEFAMNLYRATNVAVVPGIHFSSQAKDFIRLNIARPDAELSEGLRQIKAFVDSSV